MGTAAADLVAVSAANPAGNVDVTAEPGSRSGLSLFMPAACAASHSDFTSSGEYTLPNSVVLEIENIPGWG